MLQTVEWIVRPTALLRRAQARHGEPFTVRTAWSDAPMVLVSDPAEIKRVYAAPPDVLQGGESAAGNQELTTLIDSLGNTSAWAVGRLDLLTATAKLPAAVAEPGGQSMTHRCEQHLEFDEFGLISAIRHVDLPGEREALHRFFESVGLSRSRAQ